jgi:hypothetical protein
MWHKARAQPSQSRAGWPTSLVGQPGVGTILISTLPTCQAGSVHMGIRCPKLVEAMLGGWLASCTADRLGFGELPPQINGGAHSLLL